MNIYKMVKNNLKKLRQKQKKGVALTIVLILLITLSLVGGTVLILVNNHFHITQYLLNSTKALYLAEAGIGRAVYKIRTEANPSPDVPPFSFDGTNIDITINDTGDNLNFDVTATTESATSPGKVVCSVSARITRNAIPPLPTSAKISNWQEM